MTLNLLKFILSIVPVLFFFLVYSRYFLLKPEPIKHVESFLAGIFFALIQIFFFPLIFFFLSENQLMILNILNISSFEVLGAAVFLWFIQKYYENLTILESTLSGMVLGLGFSSIENIFYTMTSSMSLLGIKYVYLIPFKLSLFGILGYYLGFSKFCSTKVQKVINFVKGLFIALLFNTIFDVSMFEGGKYIFFSLVIWIVMISYLEIVLAKSQTMLPYDVLKALSIRMEDWNMLIRQRRYDRWVQKILGEFSGAKIRLFQWNPGLLRLFLFFFFIILSIYGFYNVNIINLRAGSLEITDNRVLLFGIFPMAIALLMLISGSINPIFFKNSYKRIFVISDIEVKKENGDEEIYVSYEISPVSVFVMTSNPLEIGSKIFINFLHPKITSKQIEGHVIWENHNNPQEPFGTLIKIDNNLQFYLKYLVVVLFLRIKRFLKNLISMPRFELTKNLFIKPLSIEQRDVVYEASEIVFNQGDIADKFYLLKKGRVMIYKRMENGRVITMGTINEGDIFGEMALLTNDYRSATAICLEKSVIAVSEKRFLFSLIESNPEFTSHLLKTIAVSFKNSENILMTHIGNSNINQPQSSGPIR